MINLKIWHHGELKTVEQMHVDNHMLQITIPFPGTKGRYIVQWSANGKFNQERAETIERAIGRCSQLFTHCTYVWLKDTMDGSIIHWTKERENGEHDRNWERG